MVYFGIAEEDEDYFDDDEAYAAEESLEQSYRDRPNVRREVTGNLQCRRGLHVTTHRASLQHIQGNSQGQELALATG